MGTENNHYVISNLALWLDIDEKRLQDKLTEPVPQRAGELLDFEGITPFEGLMRRVMHKILLFLPESTKYLVTDNIKKLRQLVRKDLVGIRECALIDLYLKLKSELNVPGINWNNHKGVICLTHDVDSRECYEFVPEIHRLESKKGVVSTYNFLTHGGYHPEKSLLQELSCYGSEIGLHGYTHDLYLGCRPKSRIKNELQQALDSLDFPVKGFRAPAFSFTRRLLEVLVELGIKYDSSRKALSCYGPGAETCFPYVYPGIDIWEVPLLIQDDRIFRDLHLSSEEGLGVVKELTKRTIDIGGVAVINTHPRLVKQKLNFYTDLLAWVKEQPDTWVTTTWEVVNLMEKRRCLVRTSLSS